MAVFVLHPYVSSNRIREIVYQRCVLDNENADARVSKFFDSYG